MSIKPVTGPFIKKLAHLIKLYTGNLPVDQMPKHLLKARDYEEEARWYTAYFMAETFRDYTTKDFAHLVLDGMPPLTDEDVKDSFYDEYEKNYVWPTEEELLEWFGIRKNDWARGPEPMLDKP